MERSLIVERVRAGLQHARNQGKRLGPTSAACVEPKDVADLRKERARSKVPFRVLASKYGVSVFTAHKLCVPNRRSSKLGAER